MKTWSKDGFKIIQKAWSCGKLCLHAHVHKVPGRKGEIRVPSECIVCKLQCGNFAEQVTHDCGERPFETKFHISQKGGQRKNSKKEMDIKFWQKNIKQMTRFLESVVLWIHFRSPKQLEQKPKRIHKHLLLKFYEHQIDVWNVQKRWNDYTKQLQVEFVSWQSQGTARF